MTDATAAVLGAFRSEYGRTVAILARTFRDLDLVEDAVQDAFAAAADLWPTRGVPPNPQAWIVTTARNRAIDRVRRADTAERHLVDLVRPAVLDPGGELDDELRMVFLCAHPSLSPESQVALTLRFVGGLTPAEIARAFGTSEATVAQRLSRAKAKIRDADLSPRLPEPERWRDRVDVVLAVIYAIHNEGYVTTAGPLTRGELTGEALRLGRHLYALTPRDAEVRGLLALLVLTEARRAARVGADGRLVTLADQDRTRWDPVLLAEGLDHVRACLALGRPGPYQIQAAIQAVHCDAARVEATDWAAILALYDQLLGWVDTPAVRTARVVALARVDGPEAGLEALASLVDDRYTLAVRGDLLAGLGRRDEARAAFEAAAAVAYNEAEAQHLRRRAGAADLGASTRDSEGQQREERQEGDEESGAQPEPPEVHGDV